jgi:hypothetical protein
MTNRPGGKCYDRQRYARQAPLVCFQDNSPRQIADKLEFRIVLVASSKMMLAIVQVPTTCSLVRMIGKAGPECACRELEVNPCILEYDRRHGIARPPEEIRDY